MQSGRHTIAVIGLCVLALLVAGTGYYVYTQFTNQTNQKKTAVSGQIDSGRKLILSGDSKAAIPVLTDSVSKAVGPEQEALAKLNLGTAYIYASEADKGVPILKEVSLNTNYPLHYRAMAGQFAIEYYLAGKNIDFALNTIFTGPTWGAFLENNPQKNDVDSAVINSLEWVAGLYPAFGPEYVLASKYADRVEQKINPDQRVSYITLANTHLANGDIAYQKALSTNSTFLSEHPGAVPPFSANRLGVGLEHKALALDALYFAKATDRSESDVITAYKDTIALLEQDPSLSSALVSGLYTRFHLAVFLAKVDGKKYTKDIIDTLAPLYKTDLRETNFYQGFLKIYGSDQRYKKTDAWNDIVMLTNIDPLFKKLLVDLGWNAVDLQ